jgi:hypothetical protein
MILSGSQSIICTNMQAIEKAEGMLDKDATSHDDLFDGFRLYLTFWH